MAISDRFNTEVNVTPTHSWSVGRCGATDEEIDELAFEVADGYIKLHAPNHLADAWGARHRGGAEHPGALKRALEVFVKAGFGLPGEEDAPPSDHIEGLVAEHLWYFLTLEEAPDNGVIRIERPSFKATDPGGDSLALHRSGGSLMFRLWEIKKCTSGRVSSTISRAYRQLDKNALEYLARYSMIRQEVEDAEAAAIYARLVELWVDGDPAAAPGINVTTSMSSLPQTAFSTFPHRFPHLTGPSRMLGTLMATEDFPALVTRVQEHVWRGL